MRFLRCFLAGWALAALSAEAAGRVANCDAGLWYQWLEAREVPDLSDGTAVALRTDDGGEELGVRLSVGGTDQRVVVGALRVVSVSPESIRALDWKECERFLREVAVRSPLLPVYAWMAARCYRSERTTRATGEVLKLWAEGRSDIRLRRGADVTGLATLCRLEVGEALVCDWKLSFRDTGLGWRDLYERGRWIGINFGGAVDRLSLKRDVDMLESMAREEQRKGRGAGRRNGVNVEGVCAAGSEWSHRGAVDVFEGYREVEDVMAHGYEAVPALIAALEDWRFTRFVKVGLRRRPLAVCRPEVLRIGDVALAMLERLAGEQFYEGDGWRQIVYEDTAWGRVPRRLSSAPMVVRGASGLVKIRAQKWWDRVLATGLRRHLEALVRSGRIGGEFAARALAEASSNVPAEVFAIGAENADDADMAAFLLELAAGIGSPEAREVLRGAAEHADVRVRVVRARGLFELGEASFRKEILKEWRDLAEEGPTSGVYVREMVFRCLLACADPESLREVADSVLKEDVGKRQVVLWCLAERVGHGGWSNLSRGS
jgi:hypothetical protein